MIWALQPAGQKREDGVETINLEQRRIFRTLWAEIASSLPQVYTFQGTGLGQFVEGAFQLVFFQCGAGNVWNSGDGRCKVPFQPVLRHFVVHIMEGIIQSRIRCC